MTPNVCTACLNLEYDRFKTAAHINESDDFYPLPRYHTVFREDVLAAADAGCHLCHVLREGVLHFWRGKSPLGEESSLDDSDEESYDEVSSALWSPEEVAEHKARKGQRQICIELRPGRCLAVWWVGLPSSGYYVGNVQPQLEFFVEHEDPRPSPCDAFGRASKVPGEMDLEAAAKVVTGWLDGCKNHAACTQRPGKLPRRLLDLSVRETPRLVETSTLEAGAAPSYTTLSHCWGTPGGHPPPLRTTRDTYASRTNGIEWSDLPVLFQDAIGLTRAIGCRYLWIDSLCIIQDDKQDWIEQSVLMADVYSNGYLNIAAAAGSSSSESLFHGRQPSVGKPDDDDDKDDDDDAKHERPAGIPPNITVPPPSSATAAASVHVRRSHVHTHRCVLDPGLGDARELCPLLTRAWVFQEELLSRRAVSFTRSELLWQCQECVRCECGDMDNCSAVRPQIERGYAAADRSYALDYILLAENYGSTNRRFAGVLSGRCSAKQARSFWTEAASQYSGMALTRESDRPYAVAGIASRIQEVTGDTYLAGLWLEDLPRGLLWFGSLGSTRGSRRKPGIPSWSWMSRGEPGVEGPPAVNDAPDLKPDPRLKLIAEDTFCVTKPGDTFGTVLDGQVRLEGAVRHATVLGPETTITGDHFPFKIGDEVLAPDLTWLDCPFDETEPILWGDAVCCMCFGSSEDFSDDFQYSLVMRAVEGRQETYRRVGILSGHSPALFAEAPIARVTIV